MIICKLIIYVQLGAVLSFSMSKTDLHRCAIVYKKITPN